MFWILAKSVTWPDGGGRKQTYKENIQISTQTSILAQDQTEYTTCWSTMLTYNKTSEK